MQSVASAVFGAHPKHSAWHSIFRQSYSFVTEIKVRKRILNCFNVISRRYLFSGVADLRVFGHGPSGLPIGLGKVTFDSWGIINWNARSRGSWGDPRGVFETPWGTEAHDVQDPQFIVGYPWPLLGQPLPLMGDPWKPREAHQTPIGPNYKTLHESFCIILMAPWPLMRHISWAISTAHGQCHIMIKHVSYQMLWQ